MDQNPEDDVLLDQEQVNALQPMSKAGRWQHEERGLHPRRIVIGSKCYWSRREMLTHIAQAKAARETYVPRATPVSPGRPRKAAPTEQTTNAQPGHPRRPGPGRWPRAQQAAPAAQVAGS